MLPTNLAIYLSGSIANELYSEVFQSSSVKLDGGSNAVEANDNSIENNPGDLWYDDGSSCEDSVEKLNRTSDMDREWQRRHDQFHTLGYRDGLIAGKKLLHKKGSILALRILCLLGTAGVMSEGLLDALKLFYEDQKRKSANQKEGAEPSSTTTELDHQNPDVSVLKTYSEQLHSLLSEAPLVEGTFQMN
ncbi:UNVERIFIED_CONTAM: hypothetical protein Sradi_1103400 [Sesamum radiatum]|uniref:Essential protein Yae1 N-terminal domain-containing protein n=1 Tax=Sesamum radiatum TaxID=300843 RepID=A0AAW2VBP2_SESRA